MPYSTLSNDAFIYNINNKQPGYFVEAGCNDGTANTGSNCLFLEEKGWTGIGIDIAHIDAFNSNRKSKGVYADLKIKPIHEILEENNAPKIIDFFSYDVDQALKTSLQMLDLSKYTFKHIHFEHNEYIGPNDPNYYALDLADLKKIAHEKFTDAGYVRIVENVVDNNGSAVEDWYIHSDYFNDTFKFLQNIHHKKILEEYNFV